MEIRKPGLDEFGFLIMNRPDLLGFMSMVYQTVLVVVMYSLCSISCEDETRAEKEDD